MKIFILSPNKDAVFTEELIKELGTVGDVHFETKPKSFEDISELLESNDKIIAADPDFFDWKFPNEIIDKVPDIKAICLQTTSFSWIDVAYAKQKGIPVTNLRGFSTEAVAEYALLMTLGAARKFAQVIKDDFKQDFIKHRGVELKGKKVGIIGLGQIGKRYAELMAGVGAEVVYWSKNSRNERLKFIDLDKLFSEADIIFPALAYNDDTSKLISDDLLTRMKPNAIFVSIVHKIYNHELVLKLAEEGKIFGYAFEEENGNPTKHQGNVLALPSIAWATDGSMRSNGEMWTEAIINATKENFSTRVN